MLKSTASSLHGCCKAGVFSSCLRAEATEELTAKTVVWCIYYRKFWFYETAKAAVY